MSEKLKPCPWCGREPKIEAPIGWSHDGPWCVGCDGGRLCKTNPGTRYYKRKSDAIAAWNRRKGEKP